MRKVITGLALLTALLLAPLTVLHAADTARALDLVRDGKPVATIVTAVSLETAPAPGQVSKRKAGAADNDEALAVRTLVEWVKKITDVELPVADKAPEHAPAIYVGRAAVQAGFKLEAIVSASREGLRVVADGRRVLIAGQNEAATLKAVCRFLEELGCRYMMDGPLGEVFPRSPTLTVWALNLTEKPGLQWRNAKRPVVGWTALEGVERRGRRAVRPRALVGKLRVAVPLRVAP